MPLSYFAVLKIGDMDRSKLIAFIAPHFLPATMNYNIWPSQDFSSIIHLTPNRSLKTSNDSIPAGSFASSANKTGIPFRTG